MFAKVKVNWDPFLCEASLSITKPHITDPRDFLCMHVQSLNCVGLFVIPWTSPPDSLSMGFPRQEYWVGLSCPPPGHFPDPGIELASPALAGRFLTTEPPGKPRSLSVRMKL